jgi:hypothetical protein
MVGRIHARNGLTHRTSRAFLALGNLSASSVCRYESPVSDSSKGHSKLLVCYAKCQTGMAYQRQGASLRVPTAMPHSGSGKFQ